MSEFFIQSRFGTQGNFELVTPELGTPGLVHHFRNNDATGLPWSGPTPFAAGVTFGVPSLIESNFGSLGNLEVIAGTAGPAGDELAHFFRDSGPAFAWSRLTVAELGV